MRLTMIRAGTLLLLAFAAAQPAFAQVVAPVDAIAREYTILNDLPNVPVPPVDAVSREYTILDDLPNVPVPPVDAIAREYTILNDLPNVPVPPVDATAREYTIYLPPYAVEDVVAALKIASGIIVSTADDLRRLGSVVGALDKTVDILAATRVVRVAMGLDP